MWFIALFPIAILGLIIAVKLAMYVDYVLFAVVSWLVLTRVVELHTAFSLVATIGILILFHFISMIEIKKIKIFRAFGALFSATFIAWLLPYMWGSSVAYGFNLDWEWVIVIRATAFLFILIARFIKGDIINRPSVECIDGEM